MTAENPTLALPVPVADYFAADRIDGETAAACFTPDGIVKDENRVHSGRAAIVRWKTEAAAKYTYSSEPIAVREDGDATLVTARVSGNFPGSPIDLTYRFVLDGDAIARLEIVP